MGFLTQAFAGFPLVLLNSEQSTTVIVMASDFSTAFEPRIALSIAFSSVLEHVTRQPELRHTFAWLSLPVNP